jgi:hypothetical protein
MDGKAVRRNRRLRRLLNLLVLAAIAILVVTVGVPMAQRALVVYPDLESWLDAGFALVGDPFKIVGAILLGAAVAVGFGWYRRVRSRRTVHR